MIEITKDNFQKVINENKKLVIDFWADWCNPCLALSPILDAVAKNHPEITLGKVNIDDQEELALGFNISSIPYVIKIENGKIVDTFIGLHPEQFVEEFFVK